MVLRFVGLSNVFFIIQNHIPPSHKPVPLSLSQSRTVSAYTLARVCFLSLYVYRFYKDISCCHPLLSQKNTAALFWVVCRKPHLKGLHPHKRFHAPARNFKPSNHIRAPFLLQMSLMKYTYRGRLS